MNEYKEFCKKYSKEYERIENIINNMTLSQISELKKKYQELTKSNKFNTTDSISYFANLATLGMVII